MHGVCIYSLVYSPCVWMLNTMFRNGSREMFIGWHGNQGGKIKAVFLHMLLLHHVICIIYG